MPEDYVELVRQLIGRVSETQTIEFKDSNARFEMIGRDIAAHVSVEAEIPTNR